MSYTKNTKEIETKFNKTRKQNKNKTLFDFEKE